MLDLGKQIDYWLNAAKPDMEVAEFLINTGRGRYGLFFCHLAVEKTLNALVVKAIQDLAPKSHNLTYLADKAGLDLDADTKEFFAFLMRYQLEGRYPEFYPPPVDPKQATAALTQTKELIEWLRQKS